MTATSATDSPTPVKRPTAVFVLEQTLGHVTHSKNLHALVPAAGGVDPVFVPVPFEPGPRRIPGWSNWTIRAGLRAGRSLLRLRRENPPVRADVMFVHTQVPAILLRPWMKRTPTVVSIDATPKQYDSLGEFYAHEPGPTWLEYGKFRANQRCFERAAHLVAWSGWAKEGLVDEYGIAPDRITVIPPGVDVEQWRRPSDRAEPAGTSGPVRVLFVGGDLHRKGGDILIEAVRRLRSEPDVPEVELHLVTTAEVDAEPGIVVHRGLTSNSPELIEQYHLADIFCLPTLGDCLPMVLAEAAASGLPLLSTRVGAIHEIVQSEATGELVPPGDLDALTTALRLLAVEPERRSAYGVAARRLAERDHDAGRNARRVVDILRKAAG
jgi:glycosyltransferase involved in cell wall biosynthesis